MAHHYRFSFDLIYTKLHKTFVETLRDYLKIFLLSQIGFQSFGFSVDDILIHDDGNLSFLIAIHAKVSPRIDELY